MFVGVLPAALLAWLLWRFTVDVPLLDQWDFPSDIEHFRQGNWTFAELVRLQTSHRLLFPRLILVPLASCSGWNTRIEVAVGFLLALAASLLWWRATRPVRDRLPTAGAVALVLLLSFAQFSLTQYENWFWGHQMHVFLTVLAVAVALRLAVAERPGPLGWTGAVVAGLVATFSHAAGLLFWWMLAATVVVRTDARRVSWRRAWAMVAVAASLSALYFVKLPGDRLGGPEMMVVRGFHPGQIAYFALTMLGAPVAGNFGSAWPERDDGVSVAVGLCGLVLWAALAAREILRSRDSPPLESWRLWILMMPLFSIGTALLSALGRAQFGGASAFSSRYISFSTPLWLGLVVLLANGGTSYTGARHGKKFAVGGALLLILVGLVSSASTRLKEPRTRERFLTLSRIALANDGPEVLLSYLHPVVRLVREARPILMREQLSVFRPGQSVPPRLTGAAPLAAFGQSLSWRTPFPAAPLPAGAALKIRLFVTNSSAVAWPAIGENVHGVRAVRLSSRWVDAAGERFVGEGERSDLPYDLGHGQTVPLDLCLHAPGIAGQYQLRISMLQEGESWFEDRGSLGLVLPVEVAPSRWDGLRRPLRRFAYDLGFLDCG